MKKILITGLLALSLPALAIAEEQSAVAFTAGGYDAFDSEDNATEIGVEYRFAPAADFYNIIPTIGASVTSDGAYWAYAGVRYDWSLSANWVLTPHFALAAYENGGGVDLGYGLEFRTGLDLAYQMTDRSRLSLGYYHMSNADLGDYNPGADSIIVSYSYTLGE
ncbi:MAG: acyloxyacyl hydrolase [Methylophaga sp.]|nr:acyloxyacyl hydrolase [Methylophaga sp.]